MSDTYFVYITAPTIEEAKSLGKQLVESKLAACINIIPKMISIYSWENKVEEQDEVVMIAKTNATNRDRLIREIEKRHSYETPCAMAFPIAAGSHEYMKWLNNNLRQN